MGAISGIVAEVEITHVWRLDDELVTELSVYETKDAALRAIELREPETG